jgi:Domain of unknown function (DUF2804), C-terminal
VGAFCDELLICAARVQVGPVRQTFWLIWDREQRRMWEQTKTLLPGARGEVWTELPEGSGQVDHVEQGSSVVRIDAHHSDDGEVKAFLRVGSGPGIESVCPNSSGEYAWTRKRGDLKVECDVRVGDRRWRADARGVEDESAGYHPHHTVWSWSAGVGQTRDGRSVGWNLVSGINDPPERSERSIWLDGEASEPGPVSFEDLDAIVFDDGSRLEFSGECERRREEQRLVASYAYRQPFGAFAGSLAGGIELERGLGVMEHHDAHW